MSRRKGKKNVKALTYRGVVYRSGLEVNIAKSLYSRAKRDKFKFKFESEGLPYRVKEQMYVPDFKVERSDGTKIYIEVKGYLDNASQKKMLAVKDCHPDKTFVFLFSKNNPVRKGAKMRYSEWCEKHGFDYAIGELKDEWLKV